MKDNTRLLSELANTLPNNYPVKYSCDQVERKGGGGGKGEEVGRRIMLLILYVYYVDFKHICKLHSS